MLVAVVVARLVPARRVLSLTVSGTKESSANCRDVVAMSLLLWAPQFELLSEKT